MTFPSLLFPRAGVSHRHEPEPAWFHDLNLDQIVTAVTLGRNEYALDAYFHQLPHDRDTVYFRQAIMRDLEKPPLFTRCESFAQGMRDMRAALRQAEKLYYPRQRQRWQLDAVALYCQAVSDLNSGLEGASSPGLKAFRDALSAYMNASEFTTLASEIRRLLDDLADVGYCVLIRDSRVSVRRNESEVDYAPAVERTFARFRQRQTQGHEFRFPSTPDMNHVEAQILEGVAKLNAELFADVAAFCERHADTPAATPPSPAGEAADFARYPFVDAGIAAFDREIQFFLAWFDYLAPLRGAGLSFSYPRFTDGQARTLTAERTFDIALAAKLQPEHHTPVLNDFRLENGERIIVVTGPNQSGKTTFARCLGQLHHLGGLGLCVPGTRLRLQLCDRLYTHFERGEDIATRRSKLEDDLLRLHETFASATPSSLVILNEIFDSTTYDDALQLSKNLLAGFVERGPLCVWVTFLDELARANASAVGMAGSVVEGDPTRRSYRIERGPADGLAYAITLAEKYRLTHRALLERLPS